MRVEIIIVLCKKNNITWFFVHHIFVSFLLLYPFSHCTHLKASPFWTSFERWSWYWWFAIAFMMICRTKPSSPSCCYFRATRWDVMRRVIKTHGMEMIGIMPIVVENIYLMGSCGTIMWGRSWETKIWTGKRLFATCTPYRVVLYSVLISILRAKPGHFQSSIYFSGSFKISKYLL